MAQGRGWIVSSSNLRPYGSEAGINSSLGHNKDLILVPLPAAPKLEEGLGPTIKVTPP
jgi:hypothetical protein